MSGMFQRIARRRPDRSQEPVASIDQPTERFDPPARGEDDSGSAEAPTQRIEPVAPPDGAAPAGGQPLAPAAPPDGPAAAPAAPPASPAPAGGQPPAPAAPPDADLSQSAAGGQEASAPLPAPRRPGFRERGRMRRRLRYLRKLRELQVRDLGGLVFDLRRFERKRDDLIAQKIDRIRACDDELRALERALEERLPLRDVREPGIGGTCPRCFAIYGSADRFCASCGVALGGAAQGPALIAPPPGPNGDT